MECRVDCIDENLILRELKYKEVGLEFGSPSTLENPRVHLKRGCRLMSKTGLR